MSLCGTAVVCLFLLVTLAFHRACHLLQKAVPQPSRQFRKTASALLLCL